MKKKMNTTKALILGVFLIAFAGILSSYYIQKQQACVVISTWKDCSQYCTDAQCVQFTNKCTYPVSVIYNTKNSNGTWTKHELYLKSNETSAEASICPYIDMKWSYQKASY